MAEGGVCRRCGGACEGSTQQPDDGTCYCQSCWAALQDPSAKRSLGGQRPPRGDGQRREVLCPETVAAGHSLPGCFMIFTICPNYWQRNYYCDGCGALNKSGPRWHCQLHRKDLCTKCEPGKDVAKVKNGVKCPRGDHWMSWSRNMNPRRKTYKCEECSRCYINNAFRWHCKEHDCDFCRECEPGMAQRLEAGLRVRWLGSSGTARTLMENIGNGDTNLFRVAEDAVGKVKHIVDDDWVAVKFPEGTFEIKRAELLIVDEQGAVEGLCCQCGALGVPGWRDPDIHDFFCEACWDAFLAEPEEEGARAGEAKQEQAGREVPWDRRQAEEQNINVENQQQIYWDRDVGVRVLSSLPQEQAAFVPGTEVVVVGLEDRPENNGRRGEVVRYDADARKYIIRPQGGEKLVKLKAENVKAASLHQCRNWWRGDEEVAPGRPPPPQPSHARPPAPASAAPALLPEGWRAARDLATGREYYWPEGDRSAATWRQPTAPAGAGRG